MFTKRAITKTNINVTMLTDYMGLWRKGGEGGERGKGERRKKRERGGGREEGEIE